MIFYAAPMEGVTGYIWRNAHHRFYPGIDRYYTPFLAPRKKRGCSRKEKNDIVPEHNKGIPLVPQVLTNSAEAFVRMADILCELGYSEVNLNLGCPAGTVVSKGRGSGFLKDTEALLSFFDQVFEEKERVKIPVDISVKTRLGMEDPDEIIPLMNIYNRFPLCEVIIHARVRKDMYKHPARKEAFREALDMSRHPVCYNGDIFSPGDGLDFAIEFPEVSRVMLGRGLIGHPGLHEDIGSMIEARKDIAPKFTGCHENVENMMGDQESDGFGPVGLKEGPSGLSPEDIQRFRLFHDEILQGYQEILSGDKNVLFKMKELWSFVFMGPASQNRIWKKIRKASSLAEYNRIVEGWFLA